MKTIAFITRVHPKRPNMLEKCIESVKVQTSDDYVHIFHRHDKTEDGYGLLLANRSLAEAVFIDARYVMILDDDDVLIDPDFVGVFAEAVKESFPEIVFFKGITSNFGTLPKSEHWGESPIYAGIASFCFAIRLDIWMEHINEFGKREHGGDFSFISHCYNMTKDHLWLDRVVAQMQQKAGWGKGEDEHD